MRARANERLVRFTERCLNCSCCDVVVVERAVCARVSSLAHKTDSVRVRNKAPLEANAKNGAASHWLCSLTATALSLSLGCVLCARSKECERTGVGTTRSGMCARVRPLARSRAVILLLLALALRELAVSGGRMHCQRRAGGGKAQKPMTL